MRAVRAKSGPGNTKSCVGPDLQKLRLGLGDLNVCDLHKALNDFQQKAIHCYKKKNKDSKAMVEKSFRGEDVHCYKRRKLAIDKAATFRRSKSLALELETKRGIRVEKKVYLADAIQQKYQGFLTCDLLRDFD